MARQQNFWVPPNLQQNLTDDDWSDTGRKYGTPKSIGSRSYEHGSFGVYPIFRHTHLMPYDTVLMSETAVGIVWLLIPLERLPSLDGDSSQAICLGSFVSEERNAQKEKCSPKTFTSMQIDVLWTCLKHFSTSSSQVCWTAGATDRFWTTHILDPACEKRDLHLQVDTSIESLLFSWPNIRMWRQCPI